MSPTKARAEQRHAAQREEIENWLAEKGVTYTFHPSVEVDDFDEERSLRNQARINMALEPSVVETYAEAKKAGDIFPAVVAWRDKRSHKFINVDGNHRLAADKLAGTSPAVYELDPDTNPALIVQMTYEANAKHGLPNAVEDRVRHAIYLVETEAATREEAAARLNVTRASLSSGLARKRADDRAASSGLLPRHWNTLNVSVRTRLGQVKTDEGFEALADLAYRAKLTAEEVDEAVTNINRTRSAAEQKKQVQALSVIFKERIQNPSKRTDRRGPKTPKGRINLAYGQLRDIVDYKVALAEQLGDAEIEDFVARCEDMANALHDVVDTLREKQKGA